MYREPRRPTDDPDDPASVAFWLDWLVDDERVMPVVGTTADVCHTCHGAVPPGADGTAFAHCYKCNVEHRVRAHLDGLVPISYSTSQGLEALIYYFKDRRQTWLRWPLGCLLYAYLERHMSHVERMFGTMDVATVVPSHPDARRGWDHMKDLVQAVAGWRTTGPWDLDVLRSTQAHREGRTVDATSYEAARPLVGQAVLLVDDTFTTGATISSAAAALRHAGARTVVGLTLGRQLNPAFGPARAILEEQGEKPFDLDVCILE